MSSPNEINVAVAGATGAVGRAMVAILESRGFPVGNLHVLASTSTPRRTIEFQGRELEVEAVEDFDFSQTQIALFSMNGAASKKYGPRAAEAGCLVVDNSSAFRYDDDIPLVVVDVNEHVLETLPERKIVANPNCSTMQLLLALAPIHRHVGIERAFVATYQSVSGAGASGIEELKAQSTAVLSGEQPRSEVFADTIGFNVIPHIDTFLDNGFTREEMKIVWETHKILDPQISISATAVRVPVFIGHSEAVWLATKEYLGAAEVRKILQQSPGVTVIDRMEEGGYPTAATHAAGKDDVFIGRIRDDIAERCGLHLWVVSDNLRKGAALNAVQIAEVLAQRLD